MSTERSPRPSWTPGSGPDRKCQNCDEHHTKEYIRQFGDSRGVLHHCHRCLSHSHMRFGAGWMPDYDPETDRRRHMASDNNPLFLGGSDE